MHMYLSFIISEHVANHLILIESSKLNHSINLNQPDFNEYE